jgi:hypothetical protein
MYIRLTSTIWHSLPVSDLVALFRPPERHLRTAGDISVTTSHSVTPRDTFSNDVYTASWS